MLNKMIKPEGCVVRVDGGRLSQKRGHQLTYYSSPQVIYEYGDPVE
jgi:hypothetical protein